MIAVRYLVDDVDAARAFYVDRLGFEVRDDWGPVVIVARGDFQLWLSGPGSSAARHDVHASRIVLDVPDLDRALADLGVEAEIVDGAAGRWAVVDDPSGNAIELFEVSG